MKKISITSENIPINFNFNDYTAIDSIVKKLSRFQTGDNLYQSKDPVSFFGLPSDQKTVDFIENLIASIGSVDGIVIVGVGGSNLAARAIETIFFGLLNSQKKVSVWWLDTIDYQMIIDVMNELEKNYCAYKKKIILVVISKSGTTFETVINAASMTQFFKNYYQETAHHYIIYCSDKGSLFHEKALENKSIFLEIPFAVGGRFSAFCKSHLFILGLVGINIRLLCQGAFEIIPTLLKYDENNLALIWAQKLYHVYQESISIHDLFIPGIFWNEFGNWMRQLIGESLGKKFDLSGATVHAGFVPTVSLCSTDLHSVGQLYVEGPLNRVTTFFDSNPSTSSDHAFVNSDYRTLMHQVIQSVVMVYKDLKKPFFVVTIPEKNEYYIGQLMQVILVQTVFLGTMMKINPFDQPGVALFKKQLQNIIIK